MNFQPKVRVDGATSVLPAPDGVPRDAELRRQIDGGKPLGFPVGLKGMVRLHDRFVTDLVAGRQAPRVTNLAGDPQGRTRYDADMVAKGSKTQGKPRQAVRHLFIAEWMAARDLSDQALGDKMGVPRQTVYRWRTQEHRLDARKMAEIAKALDVEQTDLWRAPSRRSVDAMLSSATPEQVQDTIDFVDRFILK